jgi:hypothetical protein
MEHNYKRVQFFLWHGEASDCPSSTLDCGPPNKVEKTSKISGLDLSSASISYLTIDALPTSPSAQPPTKFSFGRIRQALSKKKKMNLVERRSSRASPTASPATRASVLQPRSPWRAANAAVKQREETPARTGVCEMIPYYDPGVPGTFCFPSV